MIKRARPSKHVRRVRTKKGVKRIIVNPNIRKKRKRFETVSEKDRPDYEIWTCDDCGYSVSLQGVGGDVSDCPECINRGIRRRPRKKNCIRCGKCINCNVM